MSRANIEKRIEEETEKLSQQKALLAQLRARKAKIDRRIDTRRKILVGAVVLKRARKDEELKLQLLEWLKYGLTTERDRSLFNLGGGDLESASNDNADDDDKALNNSTGM
jgi:large subunit ribosomal protein L7/L12